MISVVIPTLNDEYRLAGLLKALVPGAASGLVREVIVADGGSTDDTAALADAAGCVLLRAPNDCGARLRTAARTARGPWLLFLDAAAVLPANGLAGLAVFIEEAERAGACEDRVALLSSGAGGFATSRFSALFAAARCMLAGSRDGQGLLIAKIFYDRLGGHRDGEQSPRELCARIGRRRIVALRGADVVR